MLFEESEEDPGVPGLGLLPGVVRLLSDTVKRPQMQWNQLDVVRPTALTSELDERPWVYFVHSYAPEATDDVVATCDYGGPVTAMVGRDDQRLWATQFHPEKSSAAGLRLLQNFVAVCAA
jgi:glutamine amidotransferase